MLSNPTDEHHKPYEKLLLACNADSGNGPNCCFVPGIQFRLILKPHSVVCEDAFQEVWKDVVIMAMPGVHSRKPPISELLARQLSKKMNCLELFARELVPDWSSWGNEVLRFQGIGRFDAQFGPVNPS